MLAIIINSSVGILSAVIIYFVMQGIKRGKSQSDEHREEHLLLRNANRAMLRSTVLAIYRRYLEEGDIADYDREAFCDLFENYKALGGNGYMLTIKKEIDGARRKV